MAQPLTSEDIVIGKWYKYIGPGSRREHLLRNGQRVKVLEYDRNYQGSLFGPITVWGMGPARTEDEAGISVHLKDLAPLDPK